jgi:hypothetical protein|tara:strand:- start:6390 stop:6911 length:522 start_codon:yes stop_codon:yes gene_type:complete
MKKHKAIAIPVIYNGDVPRFLTVRDKRFKEWIFVTGGCRRREINNPLRTALRELEEETRGVVSLKRGEYTTFSFTVKESPTIDLEYTVFIFFVNYSRNDQSDLVKKFNEEKYKMYTKKIHMKRTYDENDYMSFDTLSEFNSRRRWERIIKYVLKNPEFYACVTSPNRKSFAIK